MEVPLTFVLVLVCFVTKEVFEVSLHTSLCRCCTHGSASPAERLCCAFLLQAFWANDNVSHFTHLAGVGVGLMYIRFSVM